MNIRYELLEKLYKKNKGFAWNLACEWLLEYGFSNVKEWDDEFINNQEVPKLIEPSFYREILRLARQIATDSDCVDFMKFCMIEPFFQIRDLGKLNREQLEGMVKASLSPMSIMDVECNLDTVSGVKRICEKYNCEAEDLELLGYKIPDEYWEGDE